MAAARRPILCIILLAAACMWLFHAQVFVVPSSTSLRATSKASGALAGATGEMKAAPSVLAMHGLPEPRANPYNLPVELNRTSFYWGLLTICVLSVLFSSYFFN
eukprot:TRINITY_DN491_c0_g1_i5.p1 TRINITY_DN491_c0_g1~~TRINITY_DN491_c0_g1_i5.p1  ORF type:complete len:104 (-),score=13.72 TRINITY_DN491_c0_g1_i5:132-443(-)